MSTFQIVLLVILVIVIAALIALYFIGQRMQKKQEESQQAIDAAKQNCTLLVIDKKRLKIKDSGLPQMVIDQTPWYMKRSKLPIVKCKIGPQIVTMVAEEDVFEIIPVKQTVKATVSGIYITDVRAIRGQLPKPAPKKGFRAKLRSLYDDLKAKSKDEEPAKDTSKSKKKK